MAKYFLFVLLVTLGCSDAFAQDPVFYDQNQLRKELIKSKADTDRVSILRMLGASYLNQVVETQALQDSAWSYYRRASSLSNLLKYKTGQLESLKLKAYCFYVNGKIDSAKNCFKQVINYYNLKNNRLREAQSWQDFGNMMNTNSGPELTEKIRAYETARHLFALCGEKLKELASFKDIAEAQIHQGKLDLAEKELLQVLKSYKALHYNKNQDVLFLLSLVSRFRSDLKMELYYDLETIKSMRALGDKAFAMSYYWSLADVYKDLGMYRESFVNYNLAIVNLQPGYSFPYKLVEKVVLVLIAEKKAPEALRYVADYIKKHPPADSFQNAEMYSALGVCYQELGNTAKAEKAYLQMISFNEFNYKNNPNPRSYIYYIQLICNFYIQTKAYSKADKYLQKLENISKATISPMVISQLILFQFKIDSAAGKLLPAIREYQVYKKLNDSIFNSVKAKQASELQIKYETKNKDKDILLLTKQNQLSRLLVEESNWRQKLIAGCAVLLVLLLGFSYWRYRNKQRINKELEQQKQKIIAKNVELEHLLTENKWLLREVHHRVKNNLQIVISLLNSQSAHLHDEVALNAVMESRLRVQAMSLIHQKLYGCENVSTIFLPEYIYELVSYLKDSFKSARRIHIDQQIAPLSLDVSQAVPVGLILNEAITNAFKYAFPHSGDDELIIRLTHTLPFSVSLTISDNGKGISPQINIDKIKSFGLKLIKGLTEDLGGTFVLTGKSGTTLTINFNTIPSMQSKAARPQARLSRSLV
jgi:two-component sensor histidine kinase